MSNLTLGSLFDGSGGFPLAGMLAGINPVWASEIEPFPIRVTTKRMPFIKHYGNVSTMNGAEIEPVDIITFGSPCQDMSVAGNRAGLDGSRSNLFYEAIRIVKEMRCATNGKYPRYIVWENVPGAFSSNKGEDFRCVLESICQVKDETISVPRCDKWQTAGSIVGEDYSIAWRVLDAQYWGVPQRRKRIFLVADFADKCAEKILFESEGLSGYSAESFRSWQRAACGFENCTGASGYDGYNGQLTDDVSSTLGVNCGMSTGRNGVVENVAYGINRSAMTSGYNSDMSFEIEEEMSATLLAAGPNAVAVENHAQDSRYRIENNDKIQTLTSCMGTGGNNVPLVMKIRSGCEGGGKGPLIQTDKSATLSCNNDQTLFEPKNWDGTDVAPTLTKQNAAGSQRMPDKDNFNCALQPYGISSYESNAMKSDNPHSGVYEAETARTLDTSNQSPGKKQGGIAVVCVDQGGGKSSCSVSEEVSPTLACTHGGEPAVCIQGSMIGRKDENGPNGSGINEDVAFTLNATDQHAVYAMTTGSFTDVQEDKSPTLMARDYKDPTAVCYGIGRDAMNQGKNAKFNPAVAEDVRPTIVANGPGGVVHPYGFYPQMRAECVTLTEDKSVTLVNGTNPGRHNGVVEPSYTVRRLTPTECARLQGFPDWWCSELGTENPTDEEIAFWTDVFETHRNICGTSSKPKSEKQIIKWLNNPYSDSAEYKMWGNGVALPCVFFVLSGIVYSTQSAI